LARFGLVLSIGLLSYIFLKQYVCYPSSIMQLILYPQGLLLQSMFPVKFAIHRENKIDNIFSRSPKFRSSNGFRHRFRRVRARHFEILHYFFVEGLTSAAASGIGACAAKLLLPASD